MPTLIDVRDVEARMSEMLSLIAAGDDVLLTDRGGPVARVLPVDRRTPGLHPGAIRTADDFDEPLPDGFWVGKA